uniref:Transmembrane protein 160 n=1 Tax=Oncorhynchus kisutch TaxID=8019 RepID=A0A8C7KWB5_ONCKI
MIGGELQRWLSFWQVLQSPQSDQRVLRHLPDQGRSLPIGQFVRATSSRMEATVFLGTFNAAEMFWYPSLELCFLSWFRNGLLATGIGVIAFVQSDVGREAGYAFFILGGVCVSFGGASYVGSLFSLRRIMLLSLPAVLLNVAVVSSIALFWLCAVSLYIGRLEVEIIHEDDDDGGECPDCRDRCNHSHGDRHHGNGQDK